VKRRSIVGPALKSLVFVVVTSLATTALALAVSDTSVGAGTGYNAQFTDVTGLVPGDSVRIAGVQVGQVDGIKVTEAGRERPRWT
jgi:phospholipid/cholesterol/gamma-HCH transport system substrate-binding protein